MNRWKAKRRNPLTGAAMSEWLDLMLEEIDRKQQERREALDESARRGLSGSDEESTAQGEAAAGSAGKTQADT